MLLDPKSIKKIDNLADIFTHLGSADLKVASKMLMQLAPGFKFTNILRASFFLQNCFASFFTVWLCNFLAKEKNISAKAAC